MRVLIFYTGFEFAIMELNGNTGSGCYASRLGDGQAIFAARDDGKSAFKDSTRVGDE